MKLIKSDDYKKIICFMAMVCLGIGVILHIVPYFYQRSLALDEAKMISSVCTRGFSNLVTSPLDWGQSGPIGYMYILKIFSVILGETKLAFRLWSLISWVASAFLLYFMIKKVAAKHWALSFTALYSLVDFYIYYSYEVKPYMSDNFFCLLVFCFWQQYKKNKLSLGKMIAVYSVIIWFSFSAVFFVGAAMIVLCISLLKDYLKAHEKKYIKSIGLCSIVLVSFLMNYVFWLSKTSANAGDPAYWELLNFPLMPTSRADLQLIKMLLWQFVKFLPNVVSTVFVMSFLGYLIKVIKSGDETDIYLPFIVSFALLLLASALGFYPIEDRLVQTPCLFLFIFTAAFFELIEKKMKDKIVVSWILFGIMAVCLLLTGKEGAKNLFPQHVYRADGEIEENMKYLQEHLTEDDVIYVWNKTIPGYNYLTGFAYNYTNYGESYEDGNTIYGQQLVSYLNEEPFSYASEIDWDAVNEDADLIKKHDSVYMITSRTQSGLAELIEVLDESGSIEVVSEHYNTRLYHYIAD